MTQRLHAPPRSVIGLVVCESIRSVPFELSKTLGKHQKVRFLSSPLQNPGFPRVFRISGQFLWSSVAPMQLGAWRLRRCISRRAPQIESFFASRESAKHWDLACPGLATIHTRGGGRIRTIRSWYLFDSETMRRVARISPSDRYAPISQRA